MTEQNYAPVRDSTTHSGQTAKKPHKKPPPPAAQNDGQTQPTVDNRQPTSSISPIAESCVKLTLCVWQHEGKPSEAELVYWALESAKQTALERLLTANEGSEDFEENSFHSAKAQEIQNTLFTLVSGLASDLSLSANGMSHE